VTRAAKLTGQLLAFARRQTLKPEIFDVGRSVQTLSEMIGTLIGSRIEIVILGPEEPCFVNADAGQFETAIINMAVNARDAMEGRGRLTIAVGMAASLPNAAPLPQHPYGYVAVSVADTGSGIPPDQIERIFEPFFTTKQYGGTGLGLATVYGIVKQMAGTIRVESEVGRGTTFRLYFPETHEPEADKPEPVAGDIPLGHETILIVEDDDVVLTFLRRALDRHGYRVLVAEHPTAGLALAKAYPDRIHLVITDVVLPGMTGLEFVREFASIQSAVPTLYISGYADAVLAREGTRPKASQFLQKPFSAADLLKRVRLVLTGG
jgi:CheY-like chemotaxis protein